jgi:hypothetical protein
MLTNAEDERLRKLACLVDVSFLHELNYPEEISRHLSISGSRTSGRLNKRIRGVIPRWRGEIISHCDGIIGALLTKIPHNF